MQSSSTAKSTSVLILAAGRGTRMRPLTDSHPKPLLKIGKYSLIEHHLFALAKQGFQHIVINIDYLGEQIIHSIGNGEKYGLKIEYSDERATGALETAGGIKNALINTPTISQQFIVLNGDVWTHFDFKQLLNQPIENCIALTKNPTHNAKGDFEFEQYETAKGNLGLAREIDHSAGKPSYTYTGIAIFSKQLFSTVAQGKSALAPLLFKAASSDNLGAIIHQGVWQDVGTPERLEAIRLSYSTKHKPTI